MQQGFCKTKNYYINDDSKKIKSKNSEIEFVKYFNSIFRNYKTKSDITQESVEIKEPSSEEF